MPDHRQTKTGDRAAVDAAIDATRAASEARFGAPAAQEIASAE